MSNIIQFPRKARIEIRGGTVLQSEHEADVGRWRFFVDVVEADGGRIGMWDGESHTAAMDAARELARDWGGCEILDTTEAGDAA